MYAPLLSLHLHKLLSSHTEYIYLMVEEKSVVMNIYNLIVHFLVCFHMTIFTTSSKFKCIPGELIKISILWSI